MSMSAEDYRLWTEDCEIGGELTGPPQSRFNQEPTLHPFFTQALQLLLRERGDSISVVKKCHHTYFKKIEANQTS